MFIKIINIHPDEQTSVDYKGLDINQFVAGSQVYDFDNSVCLVKTRETQIPEHDDLQVLTEEEYNEIRDIINSNSPAEKEKNEIEELRNDLNHAVMELSMLIATGGNE